MPKSSRTAAVSLTLALLLILPGQLWAHGGHKHLMGTVKAVETGKVQVGLQHLKTMKETTSVWVSLTEKTKILRDTTSVAPSDIGVGERIVVDVAEAKPPYTAIEVKLPRK